MTKLQCYEKSLQPALQATQKSYNDHKYCSVRGVPAAKLKFRTKFLVNFRTILGHFCQFQEVQDIENAYFSVRTSQSWNNELSQSNTVLDTQRH